MNTLYIMQGLPGSGKTTLSVSLRDNLIHEGVPAIICSTDDFFMVDGEYKFDPTKLSEYHHSNFLKARSYLAKGYCVIVDNTNIHRWNCREYVRFAYGNNIPVVFIRVTGNFKSTHDVPQEIIDRMREKMEDLSLESVLSSKSPWETI